MTLFQKAPGKLPRRRVRPVATTGMFLVALCAMALADDPIFRVARISLVEGEVSYQRANRSGNDSENNSENVPENDSDKDWFEATLNLPLEENDQLYSGSDGRAEIQLSGRNIVRIDRNTNLRFTQFNAGVIQMALPIGSAYFRIDSLDKRQFEVADANDAGIDDPVYFEIDTPTVAVTFVKEGLYRINVRDDGSTEVIVRQGQAEVYNQEIGTVIVKVGRRMIIEGRDDYYRVAGLEAKDDWDQWNDRRDNDLFSGADSSPSAQYVPVAIPGVYDLDNYGEWIETSEYGWMWRPRGVDSDWAPYRDGYWRWFPSYGWTWVSYEPWGWTPYHYGRWAYVRNRWCWAPFVNIGLRFDWRWRPHHVAFFGWGGSYSRGYRDGYYDGYWNGFRNGRYGWLGWCPLGPRDRHYDGRSNAPRTIESLNNYHAPGGVKGMDARRFTGGRVAVSRDVLNAPFPRRGAITAHLRERRDGDKEIAAPAFVRHEDLKPLQPIAATRTSVVARSAFARRIKAPVVFRRNRLDSGAASPGPHRIRERWAAGRREASATEQGDNPNAATPGRISHERIERPSRRPNYRPVERIAPPSPRPREPRGIERNQPKREIERAAESDNPTRDESPLRREKRSDDDQRRQDFPVWRRAERREAPHDPAPHREIRRADTPSPHDGSPRREMRRADTPPRDISPHREMRRPDPPRDISPHRETRRPDPPRDSPPHRETRRPDPPRSVSPPRSVERPSSPPHQSAPPRPSPPTPTRQSAPSRPADGSNRPTPRRPHIQ